MIKSLSKKLTAFKFKYYELNIIQDIPNDKFNQIITRYKADGWEVSGAYHGQDSLVNPDSSKWECKLRKGQSALNCEWSSVSMGKVIGPQRIIVALGKTYDLVVLTSPQ